VAAPEEETYQEPLADYEQDAAGFPAEAEPVTADGIRDADGEVAGHMEADADAGAHSVEGGDFEVADADGLDTVQPDDLVNEGSERAEGISATVETPSARLEDAEQAG
jgi:hypothetical protein